MRTINIKSLLILLALTIQLCASVEKNSGLIIAIQPKILRLAENLDLSKLIKPQVLIAKQGASGTLYKGEITNLELLSAESPKDIVSEVIETANGKKLKIIFKDTNIKLKTNIYVKLGFIGKNDNNVPINVSISTIEAVFNFTENRIKLEDFNSNIGHIDIQFNSTFFNVIYALIKGIINGKINDAIPKLRGKVEDALNKFFTNDSIVTIDRLNLRADLSSTQSPQLVTASSDEIVKLQRMKILREYAAPVISLKRKFLLKQADPRAFIAIGIRGYVFSNDAGNDKSKYNEVKMNLPAKASTSDISILASDFTMNSALLALTASEKLHISINENTEKVGDVIPEFKAKFPQKKDAKITLDISPWLNFAPKITTTEAAGVHLQAKAFLSISVDGIDYFASEVSVSAKIMAGSKDNKLTLEVTEAQITELKTSSQDVLAIDENGLKERVNKMVIDLLNNLDILREGIKISDVIKKVVKIDVVEVLINSVDHYDGFTSASLTINRK